MPAPASQGFACCGKSAALSSPFASSLTCSIFSCAWTQAIDLWHPFVQVVVHVRETALLVLRLVEKMGVKLRRKLDFENGHL